MFNNKYKIEFFDISCAKLERYIIKKAKSISNNCDEQKTINKVISLRHEQLNKSIWIIYKYSFAMLFDMKLLSKNHAQRFQEVLFEMLQRKAGFNRIKSLLLLKIFGYIKNSKFPLWLNKILITSTGENLGFFLPNNSQYKKHQSDFVHEIGLPLDNVSINELSKILMHEATHLYNFRTLGDIISDNNYLKNRITMKNATIAALENKALRQYMFPSHIKENFDILVYSVENFLKKFAYLKINDELCNNLINLYKFLMSDSYNENSPEIPVINLISNWDIKTISFKFINRKIAELITATIISSKNYWKNKDELLTISGIVPAKTRNKTVIIFSNENENTFVIKDEKQRFSYGKLFFCKTPSPYLSKLLEILEIKYEDLFKILQMKMEDIITNIYEQQELVV